MFSCVLCSIIVLSYEQTVCKTRKQETAVFINVCSSGSSALPRFTQKSGGQLLTKLHQQESQATSPMSSCFMELLQGQILTLLTFLVCVFPEWEKVWSRLSAHLQPFFSPLSAYFNNFRQKIPYFDVSRQKRVLFNCFATKQCLGMLKM